MAFKMKGHGLKGPNQRANTDNSSHDMGSGYTDPLKKNDDRYTKVPKNLEMGEKIPLHRRGKATSNTNKAPYQMTDGSPMKVVPLAYGAAVGLNVARIAATKLAKKGVKKYLPKVIKKAKSKIKDVDFTKITGPKKSTGIVGKVVNFAKKNPISTIVGVGGLGSMLLGSKNKDTKDKKVTTPTKPKVTLDTKVKGGSKTWRQGMKSSGGTLNDLAKKRDTLKKGSDEYNSVQNKINVHLGSKKRHGVTSSTGTKGRKTTTTKNVPGVSSSKSVTKKRTIGGTKIVANKSNLMNNTSSTTKTKGKGFGDGKKIKTTTFGSSGNKTTKVKEKYNRNKVTGAGETGDHYTGRRKKRKVTTYNDDGTITKMKINDRTGKVKIKTRKKGGTGLFNRNKKS
tara:strand:- start:944 stop:2128 length:1185 start_codon:yes stop_codon:yes gene_type:complete